MKQPDNKQSEGAELLSAAHEQLIRNSAIDAEVAKERGYWTATTRGQLKELGFDDY